ncbi:glycosyltransferase, exosortase A system-associated [Pacificimonas flava]|uniref:Glycosyltransferase, exosortase A system-associated n=2 Tax=Pacificimonas TaxID=1960290 RepID=A0A219B921_9SPHN|nr:MULTISPECIES: TIGR04063 family PEP-CTERM/XrtA system glycosyltransferase [Pacificimonas]MBZ6378387.1 glycosyltransferase, exosortase A system-associated [Pacificimonas aurantium]OWV34309.1 glycosyltransferase, exosortase A system-associated [Pacificimonas flava]
MRILHVLDHSLPLHSGYSFRTRALIEEQKRLGWEPILLTSPRHSLDGPNPETAGGLTFHRSPASGPMPLLGEIRATGKAAARLIDRFDPDLVHCHSPVLTFLGARGAARRRNLPIVYEIRAFWEDAAVGNGTGREGDFKFRMTKAMETQACRDADAVGAICQGLLDDLESRGIEPSKMFAVPNAVDLAQFGAPEAADPELAASLGLAGKEVIGFLGSFYDYEGLDDLIAALPSILTERPEARLLLVGGGPREQELKAQAARLGVMDHVVFTGRVPQEEVARYYALVDILAYPRKPMRLTELVTPLKPLEAMAQEKLVVASDVGGHKELIEDGVTGTLFRAGDPSAAAEAITGLLASRDSWPERIHTAKKWVAENRTWERTVANYIPVYEHLVNR